MNTEIAANESFEFHEEFSTTLNKLRNLVYRYNKHAGWYDLPKDVQEAITHLETVRNSLGHNEDIGRVNFAINILRKRGGREFGTRLSLVHSELSEALEGDRKNLMDSHLPHRKSAEVEIADAFIRLFDLSGAENYDIGSAILEKFEYNKGRADHKREIRSLNGGKKY